MHIDEWKQKGATRTIRGRNLFYLDVGSGPETLVILHGYPTCTFDYWKVLPMLAEKFRVIMHDHLGFGYSDKPQDYSYSLVEQAEFALALWEDLELTNVHLFAHDYGTSVATEILARSQRGGIPVQLSSLTLCNGSIHIELAHLRTIQKLLLNKTTGPLISKLVNKKTFVRNMKNIWADPAKVSTEELEQMWVLVERDGGKAVVHQITQYIAERYKYWHRWVGSLKKTQLPVKIVWATEDPIAITAIADALHKEIPNNELIWLKNTGHFPMLENPEEWVAAVVKGF